MRIPLTNRSGLASTIGSSATRAAPTKRRYVRWPSSGLCGPFHKGLPDKLRALPPPVHPMLLAAAFGDGGNAGVLLQFIGAPEALALFAEGGEQPWRQVWTGAR